MDLAEEVAKAVVESVLRGSVMDFIEDQSQGSHDFHLTLPDGNVAALEVTTATDQEYRGTAAAIFDPQLGGNPVAIGKCGNVWILDVHKTARIARIRSEVAQYLTAIESAGIQLFAPWDSVREHEAVVAIMADLGVVAGAVFPTAGPGRAYLQIAGEPGMADVEQVLAPISVVSQKSDNRRKLAATEAAERHLFVFIDDSESDALASLLICHPPTDPPNLPSEITHLWVATYFGKRDQFVYWRTDESGWLEPGTVSPSSSEAPEEETQA